MSAIHRRRLLLSLSKIKDFIIFDTVLQAGKVINQSYAQISSGAYIKVIGDTVINPSYKRNMSFSYSVYTEAEALDYVKNTLYSGNLTGLSIGITARSSTGFTITIINSNESPTKQVGGQITIGSYDFTKYKKLKFTVTSYAAAGSVSFGDISAEITAAGEYEFDIKDLKGNYDIKFSSKGVNGYTVNNVYLAG